jgi:prepilin-type N-terminal cleavage/methylation domain-containing protein
MKPAVKHASARSFRDRGNAFTLIELLVVIATIAILASLLLPALGRSEATAQRAVCTGNLHQFMVAWRLYTDDNGGKLPPNVPGTTLNGGGAWASWTDGSIEYGNRDGTNTYLLLGPHRGSIVSLRQKRRHLPVSG